MISKRIFFCAIGSILILSCQLSTASHSSNKKTLKNSFDINQAITELSRDFLHLVKLRDNPRYVNEHYDLIFGNPFDFKQIAKTILENNLIIPTNISQSCFNHVKAFLIAVAKGELWALKGYFYI
jgi:hypothetical protein